MKYILCRDYEGCYFEKKNIFKYPFNSEKEALDFIENLKNYKPVPNSVDFITDSEKHRLTKEWAEDRKIGPVNYTVAPIYKGGSE